MTRTDVAAVGESTTLLWSLGSNTSVADVCVTNVTSLSIRKRLICYWIGANWGPKWRHISAADSWIARETTTCVSVLLFCALTLTPIKWEDQPESKDERELIALSRGCLSFGDLLEFEQQFLVILGEIADHTAIAQ
jgi:hypothetical protein